MICVLKNIQHRYVVEKNNKKAVRKISPDFSLLNCRFWFCGRTTLNQKSIKNFPKGCAFFRLLL